MRDFFETIVRALGLDRQSNPTPPLRRDGRQPTPFVKAPPKKAKHRVAIVVGHNQKAQGAVNYLGETEFSFNSRIAQKVRSQVENLGYPGAVAVLVRPEVPSYTQQVKSIVGQARGFDYAVELHFNSAAGPASGCEVLVAPTRTTEDEAIADEITDHLSERMDIRERGRDGVVVVQQGHGGFGMMDALSRQGVVSVLVEPCFANVKSLESVAIFESEDEYASILAYVCVKMIEGKFKGGA
jgi:N-acetylmuramoyl-L-alanine amidase